MHNLHQRRMLILLVSGLLLAYFGYTLYSEGRERMLDREDGIAMLVGIVIGAAVSWYMSTKWDPYDVRAHQETMASPGYARGLFFIPILGALGSFFLPRLLGEAMMPLAMMALLVALCLVFAFMFFGILFDPPPNDR